MEEDDPEISASNDVAAPLRAAHRILEDLSHELRNELVLVMKADQKDFKEGLNAGAYSQAERRILIRSIFSYIEALTFSVKALVLSDPESASLSDAERMFASEQTYELRPNGTVSSRPAKITLTSNLKFTFSVFSKVFGSWTELDTSGQGWEYLQRSIKVRDRITHPKNSSDLFISDEQVLEAIRAMGWFDASINRAMLEMGAANKVKADKLKKVLRDILANHDVPSPMRAKIATLLEEGSESL